VPLLAMLNSGARALVSKDVESGQRSTLPADGPADPLIARPAGKPDRE
jgi:hypothetical protein